MMRENSQKGWGMDRSGAIRRVSIFFFLIKTTFVAVTLLILAAASWAAPISKQAVALEKRLVKIETSTQQMHTANEHFTKALQEAEPANRPAFCFVLKDLAKTIDSDIRKLQKDIAFLEKKKNYDQLSEQQVARLEQQKRYLDGFGLVSCESLKLD
jgi:exoribonuclease II